MHSGPTRTAGILAPLRGGPYRWLAAVLALSLVGTGTWTVTYVFQLVATGGDAGDVSAVATAASVGVLLAVLAGGAVADRGSQRAVLAGVAAVKAGGTALLAALSLGEALTTPVLAGLALLLGLADGFFFPAYSALVPRTVPVAQVLAVNGLEGVLRPVAMLVAGPALAGLVVRETSPGWSFAVVATTQVAAALAAARLPRPAPGPAAPAHGHSGGSLRDVRDGVRYGLGTRWIRTTLLLASAILVLVQGPIEVLLPFVVTGAGGGPGAFAAVLAAFGAGGVVGAVVVASRPLPRRDLSFLALVWGLGTAPMALVGVADEVWLVALCTAVVGATYSAGAVVWGTLLQVRVAPEYLGRVSSLDFFVSLAFLPVSMALAAPLGSLLGTGWVFLLAGTVPPLLALVAVTAGGLRADETAARREPVAG
ncbi:MFS transporter [Geodermatophilus nigrescens]|uniref:Predicted arabinose efflux permease, MFS family n=1 Tax=Geodermatophilus nigrescens TaxID=1070870 RepID=A0A1M5EHQ5_9ACTN|nr:MFS transporter [Geodermatophilus nigrescens]SHF78798.1 Predicted arabinose efflux permease, MFS family [Geodermatophilus nigrescens]